MNKFAKRFQVVELLVGLKRFKPFFCNQKPKLTAMNSYWTPKGGLAPQQRNPYSFTARFLPLRALGKRALRTL